MPRGTAISPSVSVCVPTRNRAGDLSERLEELRAQTFSDFELVVVDDGSTDDTPGICRFAAETDQRVRYVRLDPPVGLPLILERCYREARGEVVAVFHDHDRYRPTALERLVAALTCVPGASFAFCGIRTVDPVSGNVVSVSARGPTIRAAGEITAAFVTSGACPVAASAAVVRKSVLPDRLVSPELGLFADVELWCRLSLQGPVGYIPEALVDVVGWSEPEALTKLDWKKHKQLRDLRLGFVADVCPRRIARGRKRVKIRAESWLGRFVWSARLLRCAWTTSEDLSNAVASAPPAIAFAVRRVAAARQA